MNLPRGFYFAGISCGISNQKAKKDLGLVYSETPAVAAGLFTTNKIKAAPVIISKQHLKNKRAQAIIVNSGSANACVKNGLNNAEEITSLTAKELGSKKEDILIASTGIIGRPLPMDKIKQDLKKLPPSLKSTEPALTSFAEAIMTTDRVPKITKKNFLIDGKKVSLLGVAKGAGMISPHFATLLCFVVTDLKITSRLLKIALTHSAEMSFNQITIDGDLSTNDTLICLANGLAGNKLVNKPGRQFQKFQSVLQQTCENLAKQIVLDGEGATKLVQIQVVGTRREEDATILCRRIAKSVLVKTALFGQSPNWGRIAATLGDSKVNFDPQKMDISLSNDSKTVKLVRRGWGTKFAAELTRRILASREIKLKIHLHQGNQKAKILTTDLSDEYVKINAHYN